MKHKFTIQLLQVKARLTLLMGLLLFMASSSTFAQLGIYTFEGNNPCPVQNPNATTAAGSYASFSQFTNVGGICDQGNDVFQVKDWSPGATLDLNKYNEFTVTANTGYFLNLGSLSFDHITTDDPNSGITTWVLRSSNDNYSSDIATGSVTKTYQYPTISLPAVSFTNIPAVTFRFYLVNPKDANTKWTIDKVSLYDNIPVLGLYPFTGAKTCPNQNPNISIQPSNAIFSQFSNVNCICDDEDDVFQFKGWSTGTAIDLNKYNQFTLNANPNYKLNLSTLSFNHVTFDDPGTGITTWLLRSSVDNFATDIANGSITKSYQYVILSLPASGFANLDSVIFRFYMVNPKDGNTKWIMDNVSLSGIISPNIAVVLPADPANPTSNSPQCASTGVTMSFAGTAPAGETWYWQTTALGTSTANSLSSHIVNTSGTYYVRAQNNTSLQWSAGAGSITVTVTPDVATPVFTIGTTSTRCQGAATLTYDATATDNTGITYSLDTASLTGGNTINSVTGEVTFDAAWIASSTITAKATGCNGPQMASHIVTVTANVGTPVFTLGETSVICQGAQSISYSASASNSTGMIYSLDAASITGGIIINAATGVVTYSVNWSGITTITASATGCNGPQMAKHEVTVTSGATIPTFTLGTTSTRCQGSGNVTYAVTGTNLSGLTYTMDGISTAGGNTIDALTGAVTYDAAWSGTTTIKAIVTGCNGTLASVHTVTVNPTVATPVFAMGSASTRCQGNAAVTYTATALNNTGITYSLDGSSLSAGITINTGNGKVNYLAGWSGTATITASAAGCNGPVTATHTVTVSPTVGTPVFTLGNSSSRCQGAGTVLYDVTASNATSLTYSMNGGSISAGNTINPSTGLVTYVATWTGNSTITATAYGCNGPLNTSHVASINLPVGTPVFTLGATSTRCQGATSVTYTATAANNTGITYSLDAASILGGNSINAANGKVNYVTGWTGTSIITAEATGCDGPTTSTHTVTINPTVSVPVFSLGATSTRCQGTGTVLYTATATNSTAITYSLSPSGSGNSINSTTGIVTFASGWSGTSTITASAAGCNGPLTASHIVTITPTVGTPNFTLGATSTRCNGAGTVNYAAIATNSTGITYSLDAASITGGNTINITTGEVTFVAGWGGNSVITATATGCNGPSANEHTVTNTADVSTPVFALGATSTRCQGSSNVTYTANATNYTGINYSLDAASITAGNSIHSTLGEVTYVAGWSGTSIITATATGCNGPATAQHTVTITPTISTPVFTIGSTSTRCQGSTATTYTSSSSNSTGITYSLDAASITGGNSINAATGEVTYVAGWTGTSTIKAVAAGCNGPKSSNHIVTVTPTVSTPVFALGLETLRTQGVQTITYTATSSYTTGIDYTLDPASLTGGNTINATTGAVNWTAGWNGTSMITATAAGCNGPSVSSHIVATNATIAQTPLYLSVPGQGLDRIDPVATGLTTTLQTVALASTGTTNITFTQSPVLCSDLIIKAQTISVTLYLSITSGSMPANPAITALIKYGSNNIISFSNPIYNSTTGIITWSGVLGADATIPTGQAIALQITTAQAGVTFKIDYHSMTKPSRISLLPVSTFVNFISFDMYNAAYPGGTIRTSANNNTTMYARAVVQTPFGYKDITGLNFNILAPGINVPATCVDSTACTRTYQYIWTTPATSGVYSLLATAREGFENNISFSDLIPFDVCSACPPVAFSDSMTGAGGSPLTVDVLLNDYDPNNNLNRSTLSIFTQPNNGSGFISNGRIVYLPNGSYSGRDTLTYQICDSTALCATGKVFFTINPLMIDPCGEATKTHIYYLPFSENEARIALDSSTNNAFPSNNIRTVISMKMPYPGMTIVWDHWEDGYEMNALDPLQTTTKVWGDGNPYNGIAPGYSSDIIPAGGSIVLDNTMPTNPRVASNIFFDGKDKITASGQLTVTQVSGEPSIMAVQCMKTNVSATSDYGTSFTIPAGQNFPSRDFRYTSLFIRAAQNNTTVSIDKDNNGTLETTATINEGQVMFVNGGVLSGATVASSAPIGVELHFGGNDNYSSRDVPVFPASWYYNTYYSPVPTTGRAANPADTAVVMLYNSLNRVLTINWSSGIPTSGSVTLPAKSVVRFPMAMSQTAAYKFVNPTGESFTAIQICDSYTPVSGGNTGSDFDWSFNLIAENRLTDFATVAWAPGSLDGTRNDNPVWVTPTTNTTIYVKYNGNISGNTGLISPCGMRYDASFPLNALSHKRLLDASDNDQSGLAVFTCDGTKLAAVYGEDPSTAVIGSPSWDVGSTIQPFCKQKLIFANDDYGRTMVNQPVTIALLLNDFGFLSVVDPASVSTTALLQPKNGTVTINANGTVIYTPNPGFVGKDTFQYSVCSTPTPVVCDDAMVYVDISVCPAPYYGNVVGGEVYNDKNKDGINNDGSEGVPGAKVYLYLDGNCNTSIDANELKDSVTVDASGTYQFITYPEKSVFDDFDGAGNTNTCATGSDGNSAWLSNWVDAGDGSAGYCTGVANADVDIRMDNAFGYALRLKDANKSATRTVKLTGASYAFLTFSYRRKSATLAAGEDIIVQASSNGTAFGTVFTIAGNGTADANYVTIYNQDITAYAAATTYIRFLTNNNVDDGDTVYIDNIKVQYLTYPQCYITRLDPSTVPANHHTTTVTQHSLTANSASSCMSPYDFGITKNTISISGTLFNDANGITDNLVNGTPIGVVSGAAVYAYLADTSGKVLNKVTVNSSAGTYSFPVADVLSSYKVMLSATSVAVGAICPSGANLNNTWMNTGDAFGINNLSGSGIKPGTANCFVDVKSNTSNITSVNFGIERLPNSDNKTTTYTMNTPGLKYDIPALTGTDPEDGVLGSGKTYKITSLPANAVLYYNNIVVTLDQVIPSFNPTLLKIDPNDFILIASFNYASMDAAGFFDPTPALVQVNWATLLPVKLLDFSGKLNGTKVDLFWATSSESNSSHFEVEHSTDGQLFKAFTIVRAKGNSNTVSNYAAIDPLPVKGLNYYRLKMIDKDGVYDYSKIVIVKLNSDAATLTTRVMPNPFTGKLDIYLTLPRAGNVSFSFMDINGKVVYSKQVKGLKGFNWFVVNDLVKLPSAPYILKLVTDESTFIEKLIKE